MWDPQQYARFSEPRSRAFYDLFHRLEDTAAATIVDLGCGSGELTRLFAKRWRNTRVLGIDGSAEMLAIADNYAIPGRLRFEQADLGRWEPAEPVDLLFSNAALQWLPDHEALIPRLAGFVAPGGRFAVQMPATHRDAPFRQAIREVRASDRWRSRVGPPLEVRPATHPLEWYVQTLLELGFRVDAWETEYLHVLEGPDPVLEWVKGTALRPVLAKLEPADAGAFLGELGERLREAYPAGPHGTVFPFPRIFFIATRR